MKQKNLIYELTTCAIFSALMCIFGPLAVPIGPVPVSLTNLVIYLAVFLLATKGTTLAFVIYLLLGAVGLPVFSGYSGGLGKLSGPTGGYLIGFIFLAIISGIAFEKSKGNLIITAIGMVLGTLVTYTFGTAWFIFQAKCTLPYALGICVTPFIPFDLGKIVIACIVGQTIRKALLRTGLLPKKATFN